MEVLPGNRWEVGQLLGGFKKEEKWPRNQKRPPEGSLLRRKVKVY